MVKTYNISTFKQDKVRTAELDGKATQAKW